MAKVRSAWEAMARLVLEADLEDHRAPSGQVASSGRKRGAGKLRWDTFDTAAAAQVDFAAPAVEDRSAADSSVAADTADTAAAVADLAAVGSSVAAEVAAAADSSAVVAFECNTVAVGIAVVADFLEWEERLLGVASLRHSAGRNTTRRDYSFSDGGGVVTEDLRSRAVV